MALQMSWQPSLQRRKTGPPLGLRNLGNTCYLNSVLQCLTYTPPLANFCLRSQHSRLCEKVDGNRKRECPFCILEKRIARSLSLEGAHDAPSKIENCLRLYAENFQWGRQEDAHEFLRYVIDACHNTCLKLLKAGAGAGAGGGKGSEGGPHSVVKEIFGGALLSQVKCLSCSGESNKTDEIMDISLDLFQSNSLGDALRRFFQPEILDGDNKYSCGSCKKLSAAKKQMFLLRAPNVLVIQLKRFEGIHGGKINRDISFEEVLVLSSFICKASQDPQPEYNLFGSIVHSGYSPESGHYYAYIKDATGRWYCCNDAYVSLATPQEVLSEKVYILFYLRSNQKPHPTRSGFPLNGVKSSESNINDISLSPKYAVMSVKTTARSNGSIPSEKNNLTLVNGTGSPSPTIKGGNLKNSDVQRNVANGNGNMKNHNSAFTDKQSDYEKITVVKKKNVLSPTPKSSEQSAVSQKIEVPQVSNGICKTSARNTSSDMMMTDSKLTLPVSNGNGCLGMRRREVYEYNCTQHVRAVENGSDGKRASHNVINRCDLSSNKRKSCNESVAVLVPNLKSSTLLSQDGSCSTQAIFSSKHSFKKLENFKEMMCKEACSELRSCGWYDQVRDFMRAKKRLCAETLGTYPADTGLKGLLLADAKKTFLSQVPESLKGHLIRSFTEHLLDA